MIKWILWFNWAWSTCTQWDKVGKNITRLTSAAKISTIDLLGSSESSQMWTGWATGAQKTSILSVLLSEIRHLSHTYSSFSKSWMPFLLSAPMPRTIQLHPAHPPSQSHTMHSISWTSALNLQALGGQHCTIAPTGSLLHYCKKSYITGDPRGTHVLPPGLPFPLFSLFPFYFLSLQGLEHHSSSSTSPYTEASGPEWVLHVGLVFNKVKVIITWRGHPWWHFSSS